MEVQVTTAESILANKLKDEALYYAKAEEVIAQLKEENRMLKERLNKYEQPHESFEDNEIEVDARPFGE